MPKDRHKGVAFTTRHLSQELLKGSASGQLRRSPMREACDVRSRSADCPMRFATFAREHGTGGATVAAGGFLEHGGAGNTDHPKARPSTGLSSRPSSSARRRKEDKKERGRRDGRVPWPISWARPPAGGGSRSGVIRGKSP